MWIAPELLGLYTYILLRKDNWEFFYIAVFFKVILIFFFLFLFFFGRRNISCILGTRFSHTIADSWWGLGQHIAHFHLKIYTSLTIKSSSIIEPIISFPSYISFLYSKAVVMKYTLWQSACNLENHCYIDNCKCCKYKSFLQYPHTSLH